MTMTDTVNQPQGQPRTLREIVARGALLVPCGECWARPGSACDGETGYHLCRFVRAYRRGLMTAAEFTSVTDDAGVFRSATIVRDVTP